MTRMSVSTFITSFAILGLLSGCGSTTSVKTNIDGSMDIKTSEGTATIGSTQSMPADWPEDAPAYPGSTVAYSASTNPETGKPALAVVLSTTDSSAVAATYYKTELASRGWKVDSAMEAGGTSIFSATKEGRTISLLIASAEGQTTITMAIEKGEQK